MKKVKFKKIDAFATKNSSGNPAGCVWLDSQNDLTDTEMMQIAIETKNFVSEVGYIWNSGENEFTLRYYSSEREVDFCGHATIAIMYDMIKNDTELAKQDSIIINTNCGKLIVENRIEKEDAVFIMSPMPVVKDSIPTLDDIAIHMDIKIEEIDTNYPVKIINAGLSTLLIPIKSLESILKITPDLETLKNFCFGNGIDIVEVFTADVSNSDNHYRTRVFPATFGYFEDPATGSGNSAFGYYLLQNKLWTEGSISIEQNGLIDNYNIVKLQKKSDSNGNQRVYFGGNGITRIDGEYLIFG